MQRSRRADLMCFDSAEDESDRVGGYEICALGKSISFANEAQLEVRDLPMHRYSVPLVRGFAEELGDKKWQVWCESPVIGIFVPNLRKLSSGNQVLVWLSGPWLLGQCVDKQ